MALQIDQKLLSDLEKFGAEDVRKCFQCGNCSSICHHTDEIWQFPRKQVRMAQLGLADRLTGSLEPWLCYYCGECSDQCPRKAEPGETMMSMRRWLTSRYDFTGISRLFYRSWKIELAAILIVAVLTGLGFYLAATGAGRDIHVYDGEGAFLPSARVHIFDWAMAVVLGGLLLVNCCRMWWFTMRNERIPLSSYVRQAWLLPLHFFTQKRYGECEKKSPWVTHLILMLSYFTMLVLIMFFLHGVQAGPRIGWGYHVFGYLASLGLLGMVIYAIRGRLQKRETHWKYSHETDWMFLVLLLYVAATGVAQHVLHRLGHPYAANVLYLVHMMGVVPMLVLEVPFGKWSHLAYRPLAMYYAKMQKEAWAAGAETYDNAQLPTAAVIAD